MNKALNIKNWTGGGNSYVLNSNSTSQWTGFQQTVIERLKVEFGLEFNIVIWSNSADDNYYCIPFRYLNHLFTEENKTSGNFDQRWTATIVDHHFRMRGSVILSIDISQFYGIPIIPKPGYDIDDDYYIENAKAEINIRIGQSKFRKGVLKNFNKKCALTGISELSLLKASHIVPWSHKKEFRADVLNGILLYDEIDSLFDKGYISFTNDLKVIPTPKINLLSENLQIRINNIKDLKPASPKNKIKFEYLEYHRENILIK